MIIHTRFGEGGFGEWIAATIMEKLAIAMAEMEALTALLED